MKEFEETYKSMSAEISEAAKGLSEELKASPAYGEFVAAMKNLDRSIETLYVRDSHGLAKDMTEEDKQNLLGVFKKTADSGEKLLRELDPENEFYRVADHFQNMLSKDFELIGSYDPSQPKSLEEIQAAGRTRVINLKGRSISTLSNAQNSRIPMTLYTESGKEKMGVYTKATYHHQNHLFDEIMTSAKAKCNDAGKQELDNIYQTIQDYAVTHNGMKRDGTRVTMEDTPEYVASWFIRRLRTEKNNLNLGGKSDEEGGSLPEDLIKSEFEKMGVQVDCISKSAWKIIGNGINDLMDNPAYEINSYNLELNEGERVDNRNSAMSAVASLIGASSLIARSESMKFIDESGHESEGTFMDFAKGIDLGNDPNLCKHVGDDPFGDENAKKKVYKSIMDLNVLDYLCLNVDRHQGNIMYQFDERGVLTGIQGFDNDSSFPNRGILKKDVNKIKFITEEMAERIQGITPEMMRFVLRGRGLSPKVIDQSVNRLSTLKDMIDKNRIVIVRDDEYKYIEKSFGSNDMIARITEHVDSMVQLRREEKIPFEPYKGTVPNLSKVSAEERKYTVGGLLDMSEQVGRLLNNKEKNTKIEDINKWGRRSAEFTNLIEAARFVDHLPKMLKEAKFLDAENGLDETRMLHSANGVARYYDACFRALREAADVYLTKKQRERRADSFDTIVGKNDYEKKRIAFARNILDSVREYEALREGPKTEAERKKMMEVAEKLSLRNRKNAVNEVKKAEQEKQNPVAGR